METDEMPDSTRSFFSAFAFNYMMQQQRFCSTSKGQQIRTIYEQDMQPTLTKQNYTTIPNISKKLFPTPDFKNLVQTQLQEISHEIFIYAIESSKKVNQTYLLISEDEGIKEISANSENLLKFISKCFEVAIFIYINNSKEPKIIQDGKESKPVVCVNFSNNNFSPYDHSEGIISEEILFQRPFYIHQNEPKAQLINIGPTQINENINSILAALVQAASLNKHYMTDNERKSVIDVLMWDDQHTMIRNKLIDVKVCDHEGKFGIFECQHLHCYACLSEDMNDPNCIQAELKCSCDKIVSEIDKQKTLNPIIR
jgi:hypothetical protein